MPFLLPAEPRIIRGRLLGLRLCSTAGTVWLMKMFIPEPRRGSLMGFGATSPQLSPLLSWFLTFFAHRASKPLLSNSHVLCLAVSPAPRRRESTKPPPTSNPHLEGSPTVPP